MPLKERKIHSRKIFRLSSQRSGTRLGSTAMRALCSEDSSRCKEKTIYPEFWSEKGLRLLGYHSCNNFGLQGLHSNTFIGKLSISTDKLVHVDLPARQLQLHHGSGASSVPLKLQPFADREQTKTCRLTAARSNLQDYPHLHEMPSQTVFTSK